MSISVAIILILSTIFFFISFALSLSTNLFFDALFRSFIVWILSVGSLSLIFWLMKLSNQQSMLEKEQNTIQAQEETELMNHEEKLEVERGGHIDLQTPEDADGEFIPFQPSTFNDHDN